MIGGPGDDNVPCAFSFFVDPAAAMTGGPGADIIDGGPGSDTVNGSDGGGDDVVDGGASIDTCYGDPGDRLVNCEGPRRR